MPLFEDLLALAAVRAGHLPLHASAFVHEGRGVIVAGADRSGKTGALLSLGVRGAQFVADDRVFLRRDGGRMQGLRRPVTLRPWHLAHLPELRRRIPNGSRALAVVLRAVGTAVAVGDGKRDGRRPGAWVERLWAGLRRRLKLEADPVQLFGAEGCVAAAVPSAVVLLVNQRGDRIDVRRVDPGRVARRLAALVEIELRDLLELRQAMRFAFPDVGWPRAENLGERVRAGLEEALVDLDTYVINHPYPRSLSALGPAIAEVVEPGPTPSRERSSVLTSEAAIGGRRESPPAGAGQTNPVRGDVQ